MAKQIYLILGMILLVSMFAGLVSADNPFTWSYDVASQTFSLATGGTSLHDYGNIERNFNEDTQTETIANQFGLGQSVADIKLLSDPHEQVGLGYQKVFEYQINSYEQYQDFIQGMKVYNLKKNNQAEDKQIDLKYLVTSEVTVDDYNYSKETNTWTLSGNHIEQKEEWVNLTDYSVDGTIIVSGWTNTNEGDYYEWIPTFAGVDVNQWATWNATLNANLVAYYKLDTGLTDSIGGHDGTGSASPTSIAGKINNGSRFVAASSQKIDIYNNSDFNFGTGDFAINEWFASTSDGIIFSNQGGAAAYQGMNLQLHSTGVYARFSSGSGTSLTGSNFNNASLEMVTFQRSGTNVSVFINGAFKGSATSSANLTGNANMTFGWISWAGYSTEDIDEIAIYRGRALTQTEIGYLYNGGAGVQYTNTADTTYPQFTNFQDNNNTLVGSGVGKFNVTITNTNGTAWLNINNTNITATNTTYGGSVFNTTYTFASNNTYAYKWYSFGNGSLNNPNNSVTSIAYFVSGIPIASVNLSISPLTSTYGTPVNVSCKTNSDGTLKLYMNGTDVTSSNNQNLTLGAGAYSFICNTTATTNYGVGSNTSSTMIVNQASQSFTPLLNGSSATVGGTYNINYGTSMNLSYSGSNQTAVSVYLNTTQLTLNQIYTFGGGYWLMNYSAPQNQNYSAVNYTFNALISPIAPTFTMNIYPTQAQPYGYSTMVSCSSNSLGVLKVYRNGTDVTSTENNIWKILGAGFWNYTCNQTANSNYTTGSQSLNLTINPIPANCIVSFNVTSPITYPTVFSADKNNFNCPNSLVYLNGSLIGNHTVQGLGAGLWNFTSVALDSQNYTNLVQESDMQINKANSLGAGTITFTPSDLVSFPTQTSVGYSTTATGNSDVTYYLFRNDVPVSNPDVQNLSVGTYTYKLNTTGGANWSAGVIYIHDLAVGFDFFINSAIFNNITSSLAIENYQLNFSLNTSNITGATASFVYNGTTYPAIFSTDGAYYYFTTSGLSVPQVNIPTNISLYWTIALNHVGGGVSISNSSIYTQLINPTTIDNCSTNTYRILNYTLVDEDTQIPINTSTNSTSVNYNIKITGISTSLSTQVSGTLTNKNNFAFCLPQTASASTFRLDSTIQYSAQGYITRYNYLQDYTLTLATSSQNITLRDLFSPEATVYSLVYTTGNFIPQVGYTLVIQRAYTNNNSDYYTTETSITDSSGTAQAYLISNSAYYQVLAELNGVVVDIFNVQQAKCQASPCTINLNSPRGIPQTPVVTIGSNLVYTPNYNQTSEVFRLEFAKTDGVSSNVYLLGYLQNGTYIGNYSLGSANGNISVNLSNYTGQLVLFKLFQDGNFVQDIAQQVINLANQIPSGARPTLYLMGAIMFIMFFIMAYSDNMAMVFFELLGVILVGALNIFLSGMSWASTGVTAGVMVLACGIFIYKLNSKRT